MNPSRNRSFDEWDESDVRVRPNKKGSRPRTKERPRYKHAIRGRVVTVDRGRWSVVVDEGTHRSGLLSRHGHANCAVPPLSLETLWM